MSIKYFSSNENFKKIIEKKLKEKCVINQIKSGWTNFVFEVKTMQKCYIFRFPRNDFFSNALFKEVKFSKFIISKVDITTPNLKLCFNKKRPYTYHEKIEGHTLSSCMKTLSNEKMQEICDDLCKFLISFQKINSSYLDKTSCFLDDLSFVCGKYYNLNKHKKLKRLEQNKLVLCHGDFNPGNILLDKNNKFAGVLDFSFVSKSHPMCDVSRLSQRLPKNFDKIFKSTCLRYFKNDFDLKKINNLANMWRYVEKKYIEYIKVNHKDIVFLK